MPRATPMPLDERRAALIVATEPLLEQFGRDVSTRQIADAAGVAEGTIFRAFATKDELIDAVIESVVDNEPTVAAISAIDVDQPLEVRLMAAVEIIQGRLRRVFALFHSMRLKAPDRNTQDLRSRQEHDTAMLNQALVLLLMPDQARLRVPIDHAAAVLRTMTFTLSHPFLGDPDLARSEQIVDLLLHGVLASPSTKGKAC